MYNISLLLVQEHYGLAGKTSYLLLGHKRENEKEKERDFLVFK